MKNAGHATEHHHHHEQASAGAPQAIDPVCGMKVNPESTDFHATHNSVTYHFCSAGCRSKFVAAPDQYLAPAVPSHLPGTIWTCPMHPEIRQDHPGACPICGMALEPATVTAATGSSSELTDMTRRFWIALALSLPVFVLEMGGHVFPALHHLVPMRVSVWIQLVLATPVVLWVGWPFFERGWASLVTRSLNMFTLIAMGTGAAWAYSVVGAFAPGIFPPGFPVGRRNRCDLFRGGGRHHRPRSTRPGPRTACSRADFGRDQGAAQTRTQDRPQDRRRRRGPGSLARPDRCWRSPARPTGRKGAGRRHRLGWPFVTRRIYRDRGIDAG